MPWTGNSGQRGRARDEGGEEHRLERGWQSDEGSATTWEGGLSLSSMQ